MNWNFDISTIPRGRDELITKERQVNGQTVTHSYTRETPDIIWAELDTGDVVRTYFCRPTRSTPKGRWSQIGDESRIIAWQPFTKPEPSGIGRRLEVTRSELMEA